MWFLRVCPHVPHELYYCRLYLLPRPTAALCASDNNCILSSGHFALPPYINQDTMQYLRIMKDDYVTAHCVFMLRKGSPFMASINSVIWKLRDRGVILYWEDMTVRRYMSNSDQLAVIGSRYEADNGPKQLQLRHTQVSNEFFLTVAWRVRRLWVEETASTCRVTSLNLNLKNHQNFAHVVCICTYKEVLLPTNVTYTHI